MQNSTEVDLSKVLVARGEAAVEELRGLIWCRVGGRSGCTTRGMESKRLSGRERDSVLFLSLVSGAQPRSRGYSWSWREDCCKFGTWFLKKGREVVRQAQV